MSETVTQVNETTQQIVRSRTCGLKDFYIALVQSNTATAYAAGTPVKLARAIKAKIDEKWTSEKIYSDDNTEEVITSYEGTDVELEINALAPQDRVILFGQLYEKGFLRKSSDDRAPAGVYSTSESFIYFLRRSPAAVEVMASKGIRERIKRARDCVLGRS